MRVIIRQLDAILGSVSLDQANHLAIEAADPQYQQEFTTTMECLYRFFQAQPRQTLSSAEFLALLPRRLRGQLHANPDLPAQQQRKPSRIQRMLAKQATASIARS